MIVLKILYKFYDICLARLRISEFFCAKRKFLFLEGKSVEQKVRIKICQKMEFMKTLHKSYGDE